MFKNLSVMVVVACILAVGGSRAVCQMVVHAMTGTIRSVQSNTLTATTNGSDETFALNPKSRVSYNFDGDLRSDSVPAKEFHNVGAFAVIYYFGVSNSKTAIAVKDLGKGPFERSIGTVKSFNKHDHRVTVTTATGGTEVFAVNEKAVIDAGLRMKPGRQFDPHKGSHVRVTAVSDNGTKTAVFIRLRK